MLDWGEDTVIDEGSERCACFFGGRNELGDKNDANEHSFVSRCLEDSRCERDLAYNISVRVQEISWTNDQ